MSQLSKEKRNQLILVALATMAVVTGLWFGLIRRQQDGLRRLATEKGMVQGKLSQIRDTIRNSKQIEAELAEVSKKLEVQEEDMASGDLYAWMVNFIRKFKLAYQVDIPQYIPGGDAVNVNLLPKFPYKQVTVTIVGTAYYHDLGEFIADFENDFPTSRVLNLDLAPASGRSADERENLSFRMEIVSLVKPGTSRSAKTP
jgi:Tfp pilus assembly protein PilO